MRLKESKERLAICRLPAEAAINLQPEGAFWSLTLTPGECSLVVEEQFAPANAKIEGDWRALWVEGPLDFSLTGVLSSLAQPLADARVSIFVISTFDTDCILVRSHSLEQAIEALRAAGHEVARCNG